MPPPRQAEQRHESSESRTSISGNRAFRFDCERCRLIRGAGVTIAFTLAEVLITLGVIGIVCAMTMPNLISQHQKKVTVTRLKTNYSIFSQAIEHSQRENGEISMWPDRNFNKVDFEKQYLLPYLNNPQEVEQHEVYAMQKPPSKASLYWSNNNSKHYYQLPNGAIFTTGLYSLNDDRYIAVDINGKQGPNMMGKDVFVFNIGIRSYYQHVKNKFMPGTNSFANTLETLTADSCKYDYWSACSFCENSVGYSGANCAAVIALDGWEITKNYPW